LRPRPPQPTPFPYTTLFRSHRLGRLLRRVTQKDPELRSITAAAIMRELEACASGGWPVNEAVQRTPTPAELGTVDTLPSFGEGRSEEHTSELQSRENLVCRL